MRSQKQARLIVGVVALSVIVAINSYGQEKSTEKKLQLVKNAGFMQNKKHVKVLHTSALGWTAGQNVTEQFADLLSGGTIKAGDELALDHKYKIGGTQKLPDDFTLSAVKGGGFDVIDFKSKKDRKKGKQNRFLFLGNRNTLRNLTITYIGTPEPSRGAVCPKRGEAFYSGAGITAIGKRDILIENCKLYGSIGHHIKLADCSSPKILGCHIIGGYWTIIVSGHVTDMFVKNCLIEKCQGDAIKTGRGSGGGTVRPVIEDCVFQDCGRDGIDTTGGWKDSIVRNCIFRRLFSGMDIKSFFEKPSHLDNPGSNSNMLVENCKFTDIKSCMTFSTLDRGSWKHKGYFLNPENAKKYAPHDLYVNNCIIERTSSFPRGGIRAFLLKGGHSIHYKNLKFLGEKIRVVDYTNVHDTFGPKTLSKEVSDVLNYGVTGTLAPKGEAEKGGDTSVPFKYGPR